MELENIVANTVLLKAREGKLTQIVSEPAFVIFWAVQKKNNRKDDGSLQTVWLITAGKS